MSTEFKTRIQTAISAFATKDIKTAAEDFWAVLGYQSERRLEPSSYSFEQFQDTFRKYQIRADKAQAELWTQIHLLYQMTDSDLQHQFARYEEIDFGFADIRPFEEYDYKSYLFAAIELNQENISRTKLANLTREINRCFLMPVLMLIKTGDKLTFSVINRRMNKRDSTRDVVDKVSLIKDITIGNPHRGHIDILHKLALGELNVRSMLDIHKALRKTLSVKELNEEFYRRISTWFRKSKEIIKLCYIPNLSEAQIKETKDHFLVKTLCRLMFCWFLKEKGLINPRILELYDIRGLAYRIINDPDDPESSSYYRGILRTLFFDVLNTPLEQRTIPKIRLEKYSPKDFHDDIWKMSPYINGGIFNVKDEGFEDYSIFGDQVSDEDLKVPNKIFYGDSSARSPQNTIEGVNQILNSYKFTIEENTPFEEDVALDPELLGTVFENLLAELDPDPTVARNARKNSGSFYTPREVIDFMVNDVLALYLENHAQKMGHTEYIEPIRYLIYHEVKNNKNDVFDSFIVTALDKIRILDPACGSGAFPMGMLHKITRILYLVDEDNSKWIELKLASVDSAYREDFHAHLIEHYTDYPRKVGIIRDSIFGVDIQPLAGHITKLRFFISLIVDQKPNPAKPNFGISQLPNLETNIICADSLRDVEPVSDIFMKEMIGELSEYLEKYYKEDINKVYKAKLAEEIADKLSKSYPKFDWGTKHSSPANRKERWERWFIYGNLACPFFHYELFFPAVHKLGGFDIVIGNPPYGGSSILREVRDKLGLGSNDPYGAFISRFLNFNDFTTPLKPEGILSYIVSDTFMTIKSHKELRNQILDNKIHKMVRMHPDTFKQVVNTSVILIQKNMPKEKVSDDHECLMVDMTNISIHKQLDQFQDILYDIKDTLKVDEYSDKVYAIFRYPQNIILKSSLIPFFVAPAKLFCFLHDVNVNRDESNKSTRKIEINGNAVSICKLSDLAVISQGLATGDNDTYLFQNPESGLRYKNIEPYRHLVLSDSELLCISNNEAQRIKIIQNGFHKSKDESPFDPDRWFDGKYIVPYDKGGASDADSGWLPNYYVETDFYIDWSAWAVDRIKTLTVGMRDGTDNERLCSRFQNTDTYFRKGITFSIVGMYAPTFRYNSLSVYDVRGSLIEAKTQSFNTDLLLSVLCSKLIRFIFKAYIYHGVAAEIEAIKEIPISNIIGLPVIELVQSIKTKQLTDKYYDYGSFEQKEIDKLVYQAYGLNKEDIKLVEDWYARRYPKLVGNENLAN